MTTSDESILQAPARIPNAALISSNFHNQNQTPAAVLPHPPSSPQSTTPPTPKNNFVISEERKA